MCPGGSECRRLNSAKPPTTSPGVWQTSGEFSSWVFVRPVIVPARMCGANARCNCAALPIYLLAILLVAVSMSYNCMHAHGEC